VLNVAHLLKEANPTKKANVLVLDRPWHWAPVPPASQELERMMKVGMKISIPG
jgi:hypothetical protein